jgi:hypothetical protein
MLSLVQQLVVVLVKSCRPGYLTLAENLVKLDKKHLDAFKLWVCQEKHLVNEKLWPVVQSQEFESEKKFITILLKKVVTQVETILAGSLSYLSIISRTSSWSSGRKLEIK